MSSLLLKNIDHIYTFNNQEDHLEHQDLLIVNGVITAIGHNLPSTADTKVIECEGLVALPGFVNTHHHLYQTLFRGLKEVQEKPLFPWLIGLYEFWQHLTPTAVYHGAMVGFSELLRTGCTLTADHHYVFPNGQPSTLIDEQIQAAKDIGMRFHATRGSMSLGRDHGGLPPMTVVQEESIILEDSLRLIQTYHDPSDYAMTRIALAPCSPFSVTADLMKNTALLAREHKVMMHTHLAETLDEEAFCLEKYGRRPFELMEDLGWVGKDVWYAHGIFLDDHEIHRLNGSGIAHCPSSNMKLGSGIAPVAKMMARGIRVGIGTDGAASNNNLNALEEANLAALIQKGTTGDPLILGPRDLLELACRNGALSQGRADCGSIALGNRADVVVYDLEAPHLQPVYDVLSNLLFSAGAGDIVLTMVDGRVLYRNGEFTTIDIGRVMAETRRIRDEKLARLAGAAANKRGT
ncbi:MAG: 8-oxoguanine deaminase [Candidatus Melainabacteria bacterium HGW-Melainabacteria-1]|nr:MAG: 8-oxoguanine deaminase [Candidatus Melainabacteria bacterium HGW-Melainabacteria-1]